jgi:hypothetical protein
MPTRTCCLQRKQREALWTLGLGGGAGLGAGEDVRRRPLLPCEQALVVHDPRGVFPSPPSPAAVADPKLAYFFRLRDHVRRHRRAAGAPDVQADARTPTVLMWPPHLLGGPDLGAADTPTGTTTTWTSVTTFGPDGVRHIHTSQRAHTHAHTPRHRPTDTQTKT